jgi:hypothetical protein
LPRFGDASALFESQAGAGSAGELAEWIHAIVAVILPFIMVFSSTDCDGQAWFFRDTRRFFW